MLRWKEEFLRARRVISGRASELRVGGGTTMRGGVGTRQVIAEVLRGKWKGCELDAMAEDGGCRCG